jgi:hypothetical protein
MAVVAVLLQEEEGFSVHVGATRDAKYLTITAASKTCTEVHVMDAACVESGPVLVHRRCPGALSPPNCARQFHSDFLDSPGHHPPMTTAPPFVARCTCLHALASAPRATMQHVCHYSIGHASNRTSKELAGHVLGN